MTERNTYAPRSGGARRRLDDAVNHLFGGGDGKSSSLRRRDQAAVREAAGEIELIAGRLSTRLRVRGPTVAKARLELKRLADHSAQLREALVKCSDDTWRLIETVSREHIGSVASWNRIAASTKGLRMPGPTFDEMLHQLSVIEVVVSLANRRLDDCSRGTGSMATKLGMPAPRYRFVVECYLLAVEYLPAISGDSSGRFADFVRLAWEYATGQSPEKLGNGMDHYIKEVVVIAREMGAASIVEGSEFSWINAYLALETRQIAKRSPRQNPKPDE